MQARNVPSVLFICTANICRSPMAAALFRERLKQVRPDWKEWRVDSAGTWALEGEMASPYSQQVMAEKGLNISHHRSRQVTGDLLQDYNLILTMEVGQKEALQVEFPNLARRIFLLSEMAGRVEAVEDPYGGSIADYQEAAKQMDAILAKGMQRIIGLVDLRKEAG